MLEALLSVGGGGLLGGILSLGKLFGKYKEKKLMLEHERAMFDKQTALMEQEARLAQIKGELDLEIEESRGDAVALQAAINAESALSAVKNLPWWVNALRTTTRPILTYLLVTIAFVLAMFHENNPWTNEMIFLASTAVTFWFGDRPRRKM